MSGIKVEGDAKSVNAVMKTNTSTFEAKATDPEAKAVKIWLRGQSRAMMTTEKMQIKQHPNTKFYTIQQQFLCLVVLLKLIIRQFWLNLWLVTPVIFHAGIHRLMLKV